MTNTNYMDTAPYHELKQALMNIRTQMDAEEKEETLDQYLDGVRSEIDSIDINPHDRGIEEWQQLSAEYAEVEEKIRERHRSALSSLERFMRQVDATIEGDGAPI